MLIKKRKIFADYEKEELYLNEMAQNGYALFNYTFLTYHFETSELGEYIYRIQLLEKEPKTPESKAYFEFVSELDVELVTTYFNWAYFRKKASDGPFEIHSDVDSKIKHHRSIMTLQATVAIANFTIGMGNFTIGFFNNFSQYFAYLSFSVALLLGSLAFKNFKKINRFKDEKKLHE